MHGVKRPKQATHPFAVIVILSFCITMMFIGHAMPYPLIAPWLTELGMGMGAIGWVSLSFFLGNLLAAPIAGTLVDKWGRRPMLVIGLVSMVVINGVSPLFNSFPVFVALRFVLGLTNAGIMPAAMATATDITPVDQRGKWLGLVSGGVSLGNIFGTTLGGVLFDWYGFGMPFYVSAALAMLAVIAVLVLVPETRQDVVEGAEAEVHVGFMAVLRDPPRPLWIIAVLLWVDFIWVYAWIATEPTALAALYQNAGYTASLFGIVVGIMGLATTIAELGLGSLSDRFGRFPLIAFGLAAHVTWYVGLAFFPAFNMLAVLAFVSGFSAGLVNPALAAAYADITHPSQRGRVAAMKEIIISAAGIAGPATAVILTDRVEPSLMMMVTTVILVVSGVAIGFVGMRARPVVLTETP